MLSGAASSRDVHHQTSLFHRPGIQLRACESLRHVARRRLSPPGRAGRGRDRRRRARHRRGVRQSACDAGIFPHGRADVHRPERVRLRPCRGPHPQRDVPSGRRQPAHRLPGRDQRGALRRHCPRLRRARLRPDRRLRHDADPGLRLDRLLLERSRAAARAHAGRGGLASLCRRQDQDRPRHQERRRARAPGAPGAGAGQAPDGRHQRRLHRRRGAGMRPRDRAVRHPLDRGAAAAGRSSAAMPNCAPARRSRSPPARRITRCATSVP